MSLSEAQAQFTADFVTMMVSASALAFVFLRPLQRLAPADSIRGSPPGHGIPDRGPRLLAGAGLLLVAGAAFLHGSLLATSAAEVRWLGLARLTGAVLLIPFATRSWAPRAAVSRWGQWFLGLGVLLWAGAGLAELISAPAWTVDVLLIGGSLGLGAALGSLARRSIAMRVAASGAATLLLVVLVLSLALSAAISSSVQRDGLNRLAARMRIEKAQAEDTSSVATTAKLVGAGLEADFSQVSPNPLSMLASNDPKQADQAVPKLRLQISALGSLAQVGGIAYSNPPGSLVIPAPNIPSAVAAAFARDVTLTPRSCSLGRTGLFFVNGEAWVAASYPECAATGTRLGVVLAADAVGPAYLAGRLSVDPTVSLTLVSGHTVLAGAGQQPAPAELLTAAGLARTGGQDVTEPIGDRYVSVAALSTADGQQTLALVLSTPATTVLSTRTQLYRTLFLIALGGTLLALGLAIFTGDRITVGIRRLTDAATRVQGGHRGVRAEIGGHDEVAALGSAFDAMLDSVSAQSTAIQTAADDETRLRNRMEAVVAGMSDALVAVDADSRITDFNQAAEALVGVDASAVLGQMAATVLRVTGEDGHALQRQLFQPSELTQAIFGEVQRQDGVRVPVAASAGALRGPAGELVGRVLVFRDLRHEQEVEQMKTEFLSRVGHELRTPLTTIMGYADILLRRDVPSEKARVWHEEIMLSGRRLLRIVEMLEFFASSGAGRLVLRPEPIDVRGLVNAIAASWSSRKLSHITIRKRVARDIPEIVADRRWLTLAIDELVDNAVKFSPDGGPVLLTVSTGRTPSSNGKDSKRGTVDISVSDRGVGMTAEEYAVIFRDFVQADNSDTRRFGGLGLGLAVVRRVVEGHGGGITCRSAPGRGTTFTVRIPVGAADAVVKGDTDRHPGRPRRSPTKAAPAPRLRAHGS